MKYAAMLQDVIVVFPLLTTANTTLQSSTTMQGTTNENEALVVQLGHSCLVVGHVLLLLELCFCVFF